MSVSDNLFHRYSPSILKYILEEIFDQEIYHFESGTEDPLILDCGANIGLSTMYFKSIYPHSKIVCFEPDEEMFSLLCDNLNAHGFRSIELVNKAVGDTDGDTQFFKTRKEVDLIPVMSLIPNDLATERTTAMCVDIGKFVDELTFVDLMKLDIEGGESFVFDSLDKNCAFSRIGQIIFEYHHWVPQQYTLDHCIEKLSYWGFQCETIKYEPSNTEWAVSGNSVVKAINHNLLNRIER